MKLLASGRRLESLTGLLVHYRKVLQFWIVPVSGGEGGISMNQQEFMTTKEVAQYLRVDQYTIYRLVSQKKIPAFKIGNQWRFKRSLLERWLKSKMNTSTTH